MLNNINSASGLTPSTYSSEEKIAPDELQSNTSQVNELNDTIVQPEISEKVIDELISQYVLNETLLSQKIFENHERLTLREAESLIVDLIQNKTLKFLSALDIIRVDVMKIMQQLSFDRKICTFSGSVAINMNGKMVIEKIEGKELLHSLSVEICCLLRNLYDYCPLLSGELSPKVNQSQLIESQKKLLEIVNIYNRLEGIVKDSGSYETKTLCWKIKKYCDVFYYLSHNSNFLKKNLKSLSSESDLFESVLANPIDKCHIQLYIDSLSSNLFSIIRFKNETDILSEQLKKDFNSLKQCCTSISLDEFNLAIQEAIQIIGQVVSVQIKRRQKIVIETGINSSLKNCFEILRPGGDVPYLNVLRELIPLILKASDLWELYKNDENEFKNEFDKNYSMINKKIEGEIKILENKIKKDKKLNKNNRILIGKLLSSLSAFPKKFLLLFNSTLIASTRISSNIMQEIRLYFSILDEWNKNAEAFRNSFYDSIPPCTFFNPIDLVILQIFRCQDKLRELDEPLPDSLIDNLEKRVNSLVESLHQCFSISFTVGNLSGFQNLALIENFNKEFIDLMDFLNEIFTIEEFNYIFEIPEISELKNTVIFFDKYLEVIPNSLKQSYHHFIATLTSPLSSQIEIHSQDVPLIKYHIHVNARSIKEKNISNNFICLENRIQERLKQAPAEGKFFWKLNLKQVILSKLVCSQMEKLLKECDQKLKVCSSPIEVLQALHKYVQDFKRVNKSRNTWATQLAILGNMADKENDIEIENHIYFITKAIAWIDFHHLTIQEIVNINSSEIIASLTHNRSKQTTIGLIDFHTSDQSEDEIEDSQTVKNSSSYFEESSNISDYERYLNQLQILRSQKLNVLNDQETVDSFAARLLKKEEMIQNSSFYLALIEEAKHWDTVDNSTSNPLTFRAQLDVALLLESTQKLALASLCISTEETSHIHVISLNDHEKPLIFTHDGVELKNLFDSIGRTWFNDLSIQPLILKQKYMLKKISWFTEDQEFIQGISSVIKVCERVWSDLDSSCNVSDHSLHSKALNYIECRGLIHTVKRNQLSTFTSFGTIQNPEKIKNSIKNLIGMIDSIPQCEEISHNSIQTINRILGFYEVLTVYQNKNLISLFFAVRSAEIQVGILSQALILAMSCIQNEAERGELHPLFTIQKGRPLHYTHHVGILWSALKKEAGMKIDADIIQRLDSQLSQFIGDPRYPHPNKTVLTNHLVNMHEKCYLLTKIKIGSGWISDEDKKLFAKHLGKHWVELSFLKQIEILEQKIAKEIAEQEQKNTLALELTEIILSI